MSHPKSNSPSEGRKQKEGVVEKSFKGGVKNKTFVPGKAFVRAKTPSARAMQTKSPSQKGTAKTTTKCTQVEYHHHCQGSNKEAATHCQTGLIQQQHQSQAPAFAFRHNDPKVQHTVRCCSTESLDPCDNVERWLELVKHGTLPVTPAIADGAASPLGGKAITLEMDLMQQQQQMEDCNPQEGMLVTAAATTTAIEALPLPLLAGTASSTTIDACMFPSVFGSAAADTADGGGGLSCQSPRYMLTPLAPATVAYFRRLGVPSRIYGCSSALDPSQPGQLTFQRVDTTPNGGGGGQQQQQQQRAAFAIINVNHFNFVSRLN